MSCFPARPRSSPRGSVISSAAEGGARWTLAPSDLIHTTFLINAPGHMAAVSDLLLGIQRFPREPLPLLPMLLNKCGRGAVWSPGPDASWTGDGSKGVRRTPKIENTQVEFGDDSGGEARAEPCGVCLAPRAVSCLGLSPLDAARPPWPTHPTHACLSKTTSQSEQQLQTREFCTEEIEDTFETPFLRCV